MGQQRRSNDAAVRDVRTESSEEECVLNMVPRSRSNSAALKDAQTKLGEEECALGMGQKSNYVAVKDVRTMLRKKDGATKYSCSNDGCTNQIVKGVVGGIC